MSNTPFSQHLVYLNKGTLNDELTELITEVDSVLENVSVYEAAA